MRTLGRTRSLTKGVDFYNRVVTKTGMLIRSIEVSDNLTFSLKVVLLRWRKYLALVPVWCK